MDKKNIYKSELLKYSQPFILEIIIKHYLSDNFKQFYEKMGHCHMVGALIFNCSRENRYCFLKKNCKIFLLSIKVTFLRLFFFT